MQKTKICSKCKEEKPATTQYFHKAPQGRYGLHSRCKLCRSHERKSRYDMQKAKGITQQYYLDNRTRHLVQAMKKRGYEHLTEEQLEELTNNFKTENGKNVCPYCNREIKDYNNMQYDHLVPFSEGGADILTNLIPVCEYCNKSKMDMRFSDWYRDQFFYSREREKKVLSYFYGRKLKKYFPEGHRGRIVNNNPNYNETILQLKIFEDETQYNTR